MATVSSTTDVAYEVVIGLEVHAQLLTASKMFCRCTTDYASATPNTHNCPICMGFPGTLPVINEQAIDYTIMTALALNCEIAEYSKFDRKNYFYPDLPKGYQISQYDVPLSTNGYLTLHINGEDRRIGITRIHLEEDTGRHLERQGRGEAYSLIDLNRAGVPLIEIVGEPDIRTPEEARFYMEKLRSILLYLGVNSGRMEEGALRCDANISVRPKGQKEFGSKVEIKNMNSFRSVERALAYEAERQEAELRAGHAIPQQTRGWREDKGITVAQRTKEEANDYRYFPEPDLPRLVISREWVERIRAQLPELPDARRARFIEAYGLSDYDADQLTAERALADYYEAAVKARPTEDRLSHAKLVANWVLGDLRRLLNAAGTDIGASPVQPEGIADLVELVEKNTINGKQAKDVLEKAYASGERPGAIVAREGIAQISDSGELAAAVEAAIAENPKAVEDYKSGKTSAVQFLVGQVMRRTKGRARPDAVSPLLVKMLERL
jgi:aspartyl-tRNA(Asn)/glutamyl-tRNA(Gln) amidotransferase subunit B